MPKLKIMETATEGDTVGRSPKNEKEQPKMHLRRCEWLSGQLDEVARLMQQARKSGRGGSIVIVALAPSTAPLVTPGAVALPGIIAMPCITSIPRVILPVWLPRLVKCIAHKTSTVATFAMVLGLIALPMDVVGDLTGVTTKSLAARCAAFCSARHNGPCRYRYLVSRRQWNTRRHGSHWPNVRRVRRRLGCRL